MIAGVRERDMRTTWDELAGRPAEVYVGDPSAAARELEHLFGRLGADPRGGVCLEIGSGPGRMTPYLAERFDRVIAVDVSPAMLERARRAVTAVNVEFTPVSGERLDGIPNEAANTIVCYLVLQHLPHRRVVTAYLAEIARVLAPGGEAFVQLPLLQGGWRPRGWRTLRSLALPVLSRVTRDPARRAAFRGVRLTERELQRGLARAGLLVVATDTGPDAPYRHSVDRFLRLRPA
jgi:SAM-dependent methyltransferase